MVVVADSRRRHAAPPKTNFETLQDILMKRKNMTLDVTSSKALAESLDACVVSRSGRGGNPADQCQDPALPEFNTLVRIMATRCMLSAEYFCSGSVSKEAYGHYGLASPIYTHFTVSPCSLVPCLADIPSRLSVVTPTSLLIVSSLPLSATPRCTRHFSPRRMWTRH
jgi:hypothetical protein